MQLNSLFFHNDVQIVDAILKLGHEEKDDNGGGTICSAGKITSFFISKITLTILNTPIMIFDVVHVQEIVQKWIQPPLEFS